MEVTRHLDDEPVLAGPPTTRYRLRKFARRNKRLITVAGLIAAALVLGSGAATVGLIEAVRARGKAVTAQMAEGAARRDAVDKLWASYLAQARAGRWSGRVGRRFDSLEALAQAAKIRATLELRNEAIACMALPDLRRERQHAGVYSDRIGVAFDVGQHSYARVE